jgi:hypothetical protein
LPEFGADDLLCSRAQVRAGTAEDSQDLETASRRLLAELADVIITAAVAMSGVTGGDVDEAAAGAVHLAMLPDDGPTGQFSWDGTVAPW